MEEIRIMLSADDFRKLVSGEILVVGNVKIALSDIGYDRMSEIISEAETGQKYGE